MSIRPHECGFDYLTMTWRDEIRNTGLVSKRSVMAWAERRMTKGGIKDLTKPWAWQGYTGFQCGQVCIGERLDGSIVRLTGKAAHDWAQAGLPAGHNITRLDIALTVWGISDQSEAIARHNEQSLEHRKGLQSRPYRVNLINGNGDGDTLYAGSRTSELFVRVYDKERSPNGGPDYKTAVRYECECKEQLAHLAYQGCIARGYSAASCLAVLMGLLRRRGIVPILPVTSAGMVLPISELPISSLESSLQWLEKQVRPTVSRLMTAGYEEEILAALGLSRYYNRGFE